MLTIQYQASMGCIFSIFMRKRRSLSTISVISVHSGMFIPEFKGTNRDYMLKREAEEKTGAIQFSRRIPKEEDPEVPGSAFPPGLD